MHLAFEGRATGTLSSVRKPLRSILLVVLSVLVPSVLHAQSGAGNIQGTVRDSSGAVIAGAEVNAVEQKTGVKAHAVTNSSGFYVLPSLFTGTYTVTVSQSTFKSFQTNFTLQVSQNATIDVNLSAASVSNQVEVRASDIQLTNTENGAVTSTLENERINQLPMNGRQLLTLTQLTTPGLEGGGQRANGNMGEALEYVQDGVPIMNRNFGSASSSNLSQFPDPDAIEEVTIQMAASSAQYTTPGTAVITTKSGTNNFHGSAYETVRNNSFGVAKGRNFGTTGVLPHLVRNEFGARFGGPIVLPKIYDGHNKSFFFVAFARYSLRQNSPQLVTVPTPAMRGGDFSGLTTSAGVLHVLYDPATTISSPACASNSPVAANPACRTPFPNNRIDPSRQSPLSKTLNALTPLPSTSDNPLVRGNLYIPAPTNVTVPNTTFRLDHQFNTNNRAYLRFTDIGQDSLQLRNAPAASPATLPYQDFPAGASGYQLTPVRTISAATGLVHVFSPTFFSETIGGMQWFNQYVTGGGNVNLNYEQMMGLPNNFGETGFPLIQGPAMQFGGTQFNYGEAQIVTNVDENLTKILPRHKLQFGFRFRHERFGYLPDRLNDAVQFGAQATGLLNPASGTNYSAVANTGDVNADFYLGAAQAYTVHLSAPYVHFSDQEFDTYFQDNWKVTKTLNLDLGLRWESHPAPHTNGLLQAFDLANKAVVMEYPIQHYVDAGYTVSGVIQNLTNLGVKFETPDQAGLPKGLFYNYYFLFSPRVGLAWAPFGTRGTVFRAGYGRYIYPRPTRNSVATSVVNNEPFTASYTQNYVAANQSPDGKANYLLRSPQTVVAGLNSANVVNSSGPSALLPGQVFTTLNPHDAPQFVQQFAATIEQPLPLRSVLRVSYIYNHGQNLDQAHRYNAQPSAWLYESTTGNPLPTGTYAGTALGPYDQTTYGNNVQINPTGYSNDNALQANFQRLYARGFAFQLFYVYSSAFRVGGNSTRDSFVYPKEDFLPSLLNGTDYKSLNRQQNYLRDTGIPRHHIGFNGIYDLPFGRGKHFFGNSNRFWNEVIGGFQVAGAANIASSMFGVSTSNWGITNPLKIYRGGQKITDCRSGTCLEQKLWFNGYFAPTAISNPCNSNVVSGLPADYQPFQTPINNDPGTVTCTGTTVKTSNTLYGTNNVTVHLNNNTNPLVAYNPGPTGVHPYSHTFLSGPVNWTADASLFKVFPITEKVNFRFNVDAFNVFNIQGYNTPDGTTGIQALQSPRNTPRQIQLTARINF